MINLVRDWRTTTVGAVTINHDRHRVPLKASERASRQGNYRYFGAQGVIDHIDDYLFDGRYLLVAEDGANLLSRAQPIAQLVSGQFWVNNHAHVIQAKDGVELDYLKHFLNAHPLSGAIRGTAQPKLTQADLNGLSMAIPPVSVQRRIVEILEGHLSRMAAANALLDSVELRMAGLFDSWLVSRLRGLPEMHLRELLSQPLTNGRSVPTAELGFPVLRLTALAHGVVDLRQRKVGSWTAMEARPFLVAQGDFLISRGNGSIRLVARGGLVTDPPDPVAFPDTMIRIRPDISLVRPGYLSFVWNSHVVRHQIEKAARTTAGIYKVNQTQIQNVTLPVCTIAEQDDLVEQGNELFGALARTRKEISEARQRATALLRALLAAAFSGQLTGVRDVSEVVEEMAGV